MAYTLLLAEPSLTIQRVVQLTFANEDIDVVVVTDGAEAMAQAERVRPSVVLADVALARHSGYEVATFFKTHPTLSHVPVVLLSGAFERVDTARAAASGCDLVLSKPFEPRHLLAQVKGLLPPMEDAGPVPASGAHQDPAARSAPAGFVPAWSRPQAGDAVAAPAPAPVPAPAVAPPPPVTPAPPAPPPSPAAEPAPVDAPVVFGRSAFLAPEPAPVPAPVAPAAPAPVLPETPAPVSAPPPIDLSWMDGVIMPEPSAPPAPTPEPVPPVRAAAPAEEPRPGMSQGRKATSSRLDEPVPSFEILSLTNKSMRLVPPPGRTDEEPDATPGPSPDAPPPPDQARTGTHDLGELMPSLDDYFDQLDAAFASHTDTAFRRPLDMAPSHHANEPAFPVAAPPVSPPPYEPAAPAPPPPPPPVVAAPPEPAAAPVSPFLRRKDDPQPSAPAGTIDDAYDALMKQLQEPKPRPSVVALRADDELLVERAVERVLAQLDPSTMSEAMSEAVTTLAKRVIQEEIERIRRP